MLRLKENPAFRASTKFPSVENRSPPVQPTTFVRAARAKRTWFTEEAVWHSELEPASIAVLERREIACPLYWYPRRSQGRSELNLEEACIARDPACRRDDLSRTTELHTSEDTDRPFGFGRLGIPWLYVLTRVPGVLEGGIDRGGHPRFGQRLILFQSQEPPAGWRKVAR